MSNKKDSLGDRMKRYESVSGGELVPNMPVAIRVDGRAFHTWTKNIPRGDTWPFSSLMMTTMDRAAGELINGVDGFVIGYVQSDEATVIIDDSRTPQTNPWFGNNHSKIVSISAAKMTATFNRKIRDTGLNDFPDALFDARAFNIPHKEVLNCILWRMKDWQRNSLQMYAGHYFSHRQMQGKNAVALRDMLYSIDRSWANDLTMREKNGRLFFKRTVSGRSFIVNTCNIAPKYKALTEFTSIDDLFSSLYS